MIQFTTTKLNSGTCYHRPVSWSHQYAWNIYIYIYITADVQEKESGNETPWPCILNCWEKKLTSALKILILAIGWENEKLTVAIHSAIQFDLFHKTMEGPNKLLMYGVQEKISLL